MERNFYNKGKVKKSKKRKMIMNIYVGNLLPDVTDETIREAFESLKKQDKVFRASPSLFPFLSSFL